jgi:23S rRNA (guanosine2251-2'-O)-methyltransferase
MLTLYGRKPVLEALQDTRLECRTLHLADSNRGGGILRDIVDAAQRRSVPVSTHSRLELSRISRNGRQDQGVALDVFCPAFDSLDSWLGTVQDHPPRRLLILDGIGNPQNLGMIVRSAAAGAIDGLVWSPRGNASLGPLVIKASAGTLYRAPLLRCANTLAGAQACRDRGFQLCALTAAASQSLFEFRPAGHCAFILGNETDGVSTAVAALADTELSIPMRNGVESLNVAVTASLIAFAGAMWPDRC